MEQLADQLINQNQYEEAYNLYQQCEQTSAILIKEALLACKIGLFKQAINFYRLAYERGEKKNELLIKIGKLQTQIGNYTQAIEVYNQILSVDENNPIAIGELGYTFYCMEDHIQAITQFKKCSQFISIIPKYLNKLGDELYSEYKYNTAKLYYLTAYQIDKNFQDSIFGLIDTCLKLDQYEEALQYCQILLLINPNCIQTNLRKIKIKILTNQIEDADAIVKELEGISLDYQTEYQLIDLKGLILFKKQQYLDCINYLKVYIEEDQYKIQLIVTMAKCYYKLQKYEEALDQLEKVFDVYQNNYPALQLQYKILIHTNKLQDLELIKQNIHIQYL